MAEAYLAALQGPEVKALVSALKDCDAFYEGLPESVPNALSQYHKAVKP